MVRKSLIYVDQVSVLAPRGTLDTLRAIAYMRGHKGRLGTAARDTMAAGIEAFKAGLSPADKARFAEILKSVQIASAMKQES